MSGSLVGMENATQGNKAGGYTLVEIMVAMVITLIVMGGVYRALVDDTVSQEQGEKILEMQSNARIVLDRIARDVRRTGFLGCGGTQVANTLSNAGTDATKIGRLTNAKAPAGITRDPDLNNTMDYNTILKQLIDFSDFTTPEASVNYLGEALGFYDNAVADHPFYQEGTDALTLVYLSEERTVLVPATDTPGLPNVMAAGTDDIGLSEVANYSQHDILYITDCENFSLFQKTDADDVFDPDNPNAPAPYIVRHGNSGLNNSGSVGKAYGKETGAKLYKLNTATYFVRKDDPDDPDNSGFDLLYNTDNQAIAENIEDLQFEFLFDDNCSGNLPCPDGDGILSDEVWRSDLAGHPSTEVRAVRIWVLAMSEPDFGYLDTNTYEYPNSPYAVNSPSVLMMASPKDAEHRRRYLASEVVYLRNAGL